MLTITNMMHKYLCLFCFLKASHSPTVYLPPQNCTGFSTTSVEPNLKLRRDAFHLGCTRIISQPSTFHSYRKQILMSQLACSFGRWQCVKFGAEQQNFPSSLDKWYIFALLSCVLPDHWIHVKFVLPSGLPRAGVLAGNSMCGQHTPA